MLPLLPLSLAAVPALSAAPATLAGVILERGSGVPLPCVVGLGGQSVQANEDGSFTLIVDPGLVTITVQCPEHQPFSVEESVLAGQQLDVVYRVERYSWEEELTVYGEEVREEISRKVISAEELRLIPGAFGDPIRAMQSLPGVARPNALEGDLVVRGAEGVNTRFYVDEVPIPYLFHFFVGRSVINGSVIDDVEFFPGGMPTRFGDVTQAVVNARTLQDKPKPGVHGRMSADLLDSAASLSGGDDAFRWEIGGRYAWVGGLIGLGSRIATATQGGRGFEASWVNPRYFDYSARAEWSLGQHEVSFMALGARDALIFHPGRTDGDGDGRPDPPEPVDLPFDPNRILDSFFHRMSARVEFRDGERQSTTWFAAGPDQEANLIEGIGQLANGVEFGRAAGTDFLVHRDDRFALSATGVLRTGARTQVRPVFIEDYRGLDSADDRIPTTRDLQLSQAGWIEYQKQLGATWIASGMRGTYYAFNRQQHISFEPRLTVRHTLSKTWTAAGFAGRFSQIPPADRYARSIGNPELTLMRAWQASASLEGRWPSGVELDLAVYATAMSNLVVKEIETRVEVYVDPLDGGFVSDRAFSTLVPVYRDVDGLAYGVEGLLRARPNNGWFGWVSLALSRSVRYDGERVYPGSYDQPIALTAIGAREVAKGWRVSARVRLTSGHPFTPLYGSYNPVYDSYEGFAGPTNSARFSVFRSLDVRIDKTWTAKRARWTLYADVYNATNARNFLAATYTPNFAKIVPIIWIPIIPALGLEVAF